MGMIPLPDGVNHVVTFAEYARVGGELDAARADRDRLAAENAELRADLVVVGGAFSHAYEARIAELEAELARVKAESLRVVKDGDVCDILAAKSQYVTDEEGELWECHPDPADDGREVRSVLTGCGGYFADTRVWPVHLEHWEDEG